MKITLLFVIFLVYNKHMKNIEFDNNKVILIEEDYFAIKPTLDCGQAFRWNENELGQMVGVVGNRALTVYKMENDIVLSGCTKADYEGFWENYFDLGFDYKGLIESYKGDERIYKGAHYAYGLRMLKQEPFETLISFIISANNNVKRIKGIIERICQKYGEKIGDNLYSFPSAQMLKDVTVEDFASLGAGYRAKYLQGTIKSINDGYDLLSLNDLDYLSAKKEIQKLKGIGPKVADCILLYAYKYRSAFPVDVWMKRIMENFYFDKKEMSKKAIEDYAMENFGDNAGVLQLFLFNYARNNM